jgi:hypothetical protein
MPDRWPPIAVVMDASFGFAGTWKQSRARALI